MSPHVFESRRLRRGSAKSWRKALGGFGTNLRGMRGFDRILILYYRGKVSWPLALAATLTGARVCYRHGVQDWREFPDTVLNQILAAKLLEIPWGKPRQPRICLGEGDRHLAQRFMAAWSARSQAVVLIDIQWNRIHPSWGSEKYARVANILTACGATVMFNGGVDAQIEEFKRIEEELASGITVIERPTPLELAAVLSHCDLLIGDPSGPTFMARALGVNVVTVAGPGVYPPGAGDHRFGPVSWPRPAGHTVITKTDCCKVNRSAACQCWQPKTRGLAKAVMKRLDIWEPWKTARKRLLKRLGRHRSAAATENSRYACLEAVDVTEVVRVAQAHLFGAEAVSHETTAPHHVTTPEAGICAGAAAGRAARLAT